MAHVPSAIWEMFVNRGGQVAIIDAQTHQLVHLLSTGNRPLGIAFSHDSSTGFVSRPGEGEVLEIDTQNEYLITRRIKVPGSPDGLIWIDDQP